MCQQYWFAKLNALLYGLGLESTPHTPASADAIAKASDRALFDRIPTDAFPTYISHLLSGASYPELIFRQTSKRSYKRRSNSTIPHYSPAYPTPPTSPPSNSISGGCGAVCPNKSLAIAPKPLSPPPPPSFPMSPSGAKPASPPQWPEP
ncbi:hypothetical protein [Synechococcus sp. PCC 7336]|uniref:hypothetical protein n=1 Tax=Synechococcus sp. PCC 7336 TaxID=195250 RepID=UPI001D0CF99E|nr:hypothetical protein [Synechococcus sp. PCC 7336]